MNAARISWLLVVVGLSSGSATDGRPTGQPIYPGTMAAKNRGARAATTGCHHIRSCPGRLVRGSGVRQACRRARGCGRSSTAGRPDATPPLVERCVESCSCGVGGRAPLQRARRREFFGSLPAHGQGVNRSLGAGEWQFREDDLAVEVAVRVAGSAISPAARQGAHDTQAASAFVVRKRGFGQGSGRLRVGVPDFDEECPPCVHKIEPYASRPASSSAGDVQISERHYSDSSVVRGVCTRTHGRIRARPDTRAWGDPSCGDNRGRTSYYRPSTHNAPSASL